MKEHLLAGLACAACITGCVAAAPADKPRGVPAKIEPHPVTAPVALKNPGFENARRAGERCPEHWSCTMHNDPDAFRFAIEEAAPAEGRQALCIERVRDEPWALATQGIHDASLRGKRLRFSLAVRVERADGPGTGPWVLVHGPQGNLLHEERPAAATSGWQRIAIEFDVAPTAQMVEVGAAMMGGGRACIDDARLEVVS